MSIELKIKKLRPNAKIPFRATPGSAGMDLYACIDAPITLESGGHQVVPTGISIELPSNEYVALIFARSGLAVKHGIGLSNSVGVIDSDYRGELCVSLINQYAESCTIDPDERIAQLVIMPVVPAEPFEVEELSSTARGEGGFGSTGKS